jgi:hypothetical protein
MRKYKKEKDANASLSHQAANKKEILDLQWFVLQGAIGVAQPGLIFQ